MKPRGPTPTKSSVSAFEEGGVAALLCGGPLSDELLYLPTPVIHFCSPLVG
jgi:hypothetical protein